MSDHFDGYRKWLGISSKHRPPTHYQLLGILLDEEDEEVVRAAIEQRRQYVESRRGQGQDEAVTEILYQLDEAAVTLFNPEMRRAYDRRQNLWEKRKKSRRVDPHAPASRIESRPSRAVGEDSDLVKTFAGIVAVICIGFGVIAWLTFGLWDKAPRPPAAARQVIQPQPIALPVVPAAALAPVVQVPVPPAPVAQETVHQAPVESLPSSPDHPDAALVRSQQQSRIAPDDGKTIVVEEDSGSLNNPGESSRRKRKRQKNQSLPVIAPRKR